MNYKRIIFICYALIVVVFVYICGISYAYVNAPKDTEIVEEKNSNLSENLDIKYNETSNLSFVNAVPGDKIIKTFIVSNTNNTSAYYNIVFENVVNNFEYEDDLVYKLYSKNGAYVNTKILPNSDSFIASNILIKPNETHEYMLEVEFVKRNTDQSVNLNKTFSSNITINESEDYYAYNENSLGKIIFDSSLGNTVNDEIDGVYYTNSSLNGSTIYYYRGSNALNNNVLLGNMCFKIIRTTSDGGIKLIYNGLFDGDCNNDKTNIGSSEFNKKNNYNTYVGYMSGNVNSSTYEDEHNNSNSSDIKILLDNWYSSNLSNYSNIISNTSFYCNDRTTRGFSIKGVTYGIEGFSNKNTGYKSYYDLINNFSSFDCSNINDRFSVNSENGNNKLVNSIGLIEANELYYSGYLNKTDNFLRTNYNYWTMSSAYFNGSGSYNIIASNGELKPCLVSNKNYVRPVIIINKDTKVKSGNGSLTSPYVIE